MNRQFNMAENELLQGHFQFKMLPINNYELKTKVKNNYCNRRTLKFYRVNRSVNFFNRAINRD